MGTIFCDSRATLAKNDAFLVIETPCGVAVRDGTRDLSTAVVLRIREAQPSLKMTGVGLL